MDEWDDRQLYSVREFSRILAIHRRTTLKWIHCEIIAKEDWLRLPKGHIRIRERALRRIYEAEK